ncbi:MAG: YqaE/Pmp3 family membrane protein [Akkermansiaceae bacterium]
MRYFFCLFFPPLAVLLCGGKLGSCLLNVVLTLCGWIPGVIHAFLVVNEYKADKRMEKMVRMMKG